MLEQAVTEAQSFESRISSLQTWIAKVDEVLSEHIENDVCMEDLPHDFQVSRNDFLEFDCCLSFF